jgi:group I intron endonuclease
MIYSIYKITNKVNNKVYIGFTQDTETRWKNHRNCKLDRPLYNSIKKHGIDNFSFEIIYKSDDRDHTLLIMEPYFIELYEAYTKGYNCVKGGINTNTDEHRQKLSDRMKTNNPMKNPETAAKVSKSLMGKKPTITKERNEKIRQSKIGIKNHNFGKTETADILNKKKFTCSKCGIETNKGNYKRWHEDKCRKI